MSSGHSDFSEADIGAGDDFADLGIGTNIPETHSMISELDFMDLYVRIDTHAGYGTESRYQTEESSAMLIVPDRYNADVDKIRDALRTLDASEGGIPAKGFRFFHDNTRYRGGKTRTISANPQFDYEEWVCFRRFKTKTPNIDELSGWEDFNKNYLKYIMGTSGGGILIIAGGTGDGKTTTGVGLLTYSSKANPGLTFMIEDPCEYILNGPDSNAPEKSMYMQHEVVQESDWADMMKVGLRFHPRTFYVGEVRDADTAAQALLAGVTGHLVILTLHGFSCSGAITALIQRASSVMGATMARDLLADGLLAVVHQTRNVRQENGKILKFKMSILEGGKVTGSVREHIRNSKTKLIEGELSNQANVRRNEFRRPESAVRGPISGPGGNASGGGSQRQGGDMGGTQRTPQKPKKGFFSFGG